MNSSILERLRTDLAGLRTAGLYKSERVIAGPQGAVIRAGERDVINLCANNYLGLANHPAVREAQVVVGAQVDDVTLAGANDRALRAGDYALVFVKSRRAQAGKIRTQTLQNRVTHRMNYTRTM